VSRVFDSHSPPSDHDMPLQINEDLFKAFPITGTSGEIRCFLCEVSQYHFAAGIIWSVRWKNGSVRYYNSEDESKFVIFVSCLL